MKLRLPSHGSTTRFKGVVKYQYVPILFAVVFGAIAVLALVQSHAATTTISFQAEDGALSGRAASVSDSSASGNAAVKFTAASSDPNNISVEPRIGGVPIPTQGLYWGGISKANTADIATVPGCGGSGWPMIECKIGWAATQLGILSGHTQSDGKYHTSLEHFFYPDCSSTPTKDFQAGGKVYISAHTPGRKVILLDMKCGSPWSVLANGGGNTSSDAKLKALVPYVDSVGVPVVWSIYNEPENDTCGQNSNQGTPDDYRAMFRQAAADIRGQHPHNISIASTMQGYTLNVAQRQNTYQVPFTGCSQSNLSLALHNPNNYYPGDDAVDFLTYQEYDHDTGDFAGSYQVYQDYMKMACPAVHPSKNYSCTNGVKQNKPMGSSEFGISGCKDFRTKYFGDASTELVNFPQIKYLSYWSSQDNDKFADFIDYPYQTVDPTVQSHLDCGTDTSHASLKAYTQWSLSPYVTNLTF